MSFVPYEHILGHDTPVYVGASTRLTENKTPPEAYLRGWSSFKLGKRKKSTSNLSITSSTQNDLEHAASHTTASPSRLLKRNTGPLTFTAPSARASAGPEHEAGSPHYSSPETGAHGDIDAPGHPITHQSGDIEMTSSTDFGGSTSSPAPQGKESNVMSPPQAEPSLQHTNNLKSQEEPLDDTGTKVENFVGMHPQRYALFQSQDREQAREPGHKRDLKITGLRSCPMVNIRVGKLRAPYLLPEHVLCQHSRFFRSKLQTAELNARPREVALPRVAVQIFEPVIEWFNRGTLGHVPDGFDGLLSVYYLSEVLGIPTLGNPVMDSIRRYYRNNPRPNFLDIGRIQQIYQETVAGSPLRRFAVQASFWNLINDGCEVSHYVGGPDINADFVRDFIEIMEKTTKVKVDPRYGADCTFHVHEDGKRCGSPPKEGTS